MRRGERRDDRQRVVITGMGVITVVGDSPARFHESLVAGRSGITQWKRPRDERHYSRIGGDLSDFDLASHLEREGAS
jgi:3-oxoacyl-[acyl-carrier-protein] synthase II